MFYFLIYILRKLAQKLKINPKALVKQLIVFILEKRSKIKINSLSESVIKQNFEEQSDMELSDSQSID